MKLSNILSFLKICKDIDDKEIIDISENSKRIKKGDLFISINGSSNKENNIKEALANGASYILDVEKEKIDINKIHNLYYYFYSFIPKTKIIGITGTNGKSSTSHFLNETLNKLGKKCRNFSCVKGKYSFYSELTSPTFEDIFFHLLKHKDLDYLILECSSISIFKKREEGIIFYYKILTSINEDHLDFHNSLEEYIKTKIDFIKDKETYSLVPFSLKKYFIKEDNIFFVNDEYEEIESNLFSSSFVYEGRMYKVKFFSKELIKDMILVINLLYKLGYSYFDIFKVLKQIQTLKGRLDCISFSPLIFIDYAHTSSSLESSLIALKNISGKKIIVILGSGGNRQKSKRKEYGDILNKYAYKIILTSDNPRFEDSKKICEEIKGEYDFEIEINREEAIKKGIEILDESSILLIEGKGHEDYIEIKGNKIHYSDYEVVNKYLNE